MLVTHLGRTSIARSWSPAEHHTTPLAWWVASASNCFEDDAGTDACENTDGVAVWKDISGNTQHLAQTSAGSRPAFGTTTWNSTNPSVTFTTDSLTRTTGTLLSTAAGNDQPLTIFLTFQCVSSAHTGTILCWDNSGGNEAFQVNLENPGPPSNTITVGRRDTAGSVVQRSAGDLSTNRTRLAVFFSGTVVSIWVNGVFTTNESMNVGVLTTINRFRMGDGLSGNFDGKISEALIYAGDQASFVEEYYAYSLNTWGG